MAQEILHPKSISNNLEAYFGYVISTVEDFKHVKIVLKNNTANTTLYSNTISSHDEFRWPTIGNQPLSANCEYTITLQTFANRSNGSNILRWSWWVIDGEVIAVDNLPPEYSNNPDIFNARYQVTNSAVFKSIQWWLTTANGVAVAGANGIIPITNTSDIRLPIPDLADGTYLYYDTVKFANDEQKPLVSPYPYQFTVDTVAPIAYIVNPPTPYDGSTTFNFTVSANEQLSSYYYDFDNGAVTGHNLAGLMLTIIGVTEGSHTISVWGVDMATNLQTTNINTETWICDATAPNFTISPVSGYYNNPTTCTLTVYENNEVSAYWTHQIGSVPPSPTTASTRIMLSPAPSIASNASTGTFVTTEGIDGIYYNKFLIRDIASNATTATGYNYVKDIVPPYYTLTPTAGAYNRPVTLDFNYVTPVNEAGSIIYYSLESSAVAPVYYSYDSTHKPTLYEIDNYVKHYAVDLATNTTTVTDTYYEVDFSEAISGINNIIINELVTEEFGIFLTYGYFSYFDYKNLSVTKYTSPNYYLKAIIGYDLDNVYLVGASPDGVNKVCLYTFDRTTKVTTYTVMPNLANITSNSDGMHQKFTGKYDSATGDIRMVCMDGISQAKKLIYYRVNKSNLMTVMASASLDPPLLVPASQYIADYNINFVTSWDNNNKDNIVRLKLIDAGGGETVNIAIYRIEETNPSNISISVLRNKTLPSQTWSSWLFTVTQYKEIIIFRNENEYNSGLDLKGLNPQRYNLNTLYLNEPLSADLVIGRTYTITTGGSIGTGTIYNRDLYQNKIVISNPNGITINNTTTIGSYSVSSSSVIPTGGTFDYITTATSADQFWNVMPQTYFNKPVNLITFDDNNNMFFNGGFKFKLLSGYYYSDLVHFTLVVSASEYNNFTIGNMYSVKGEPTYGTKDCFLASKNYSPVDPDIVSLSFSTSGGVAVYQNSSSIPIIINNSVTALNWDKNISPVGGTILRIDFKTNNNNIFDNPKIYNYKKISGSYSSYAYCSFNITKRTLWYYGWNNGSVASITRDRLT